MAIATQSKAAMTHAPVIPANQSTNGIHSTGLRSYVFGR